MKFRFDTKMRSILLVAAVLLGGCADVPNQITGVVMGQMSRRPNPFCDGESASNRQQCTAQLIESLSFARIGSEVAAFPEGQGTCAYAYVDFGDGSALSGFTNQAVDRRGLWRVPHVYDGWPGKKTVRVKGAAGCYGEVARDISVGIGADGRETLRAIFRADPAHYCSDVRNFATGQVMPALRKGTGVRIETDGRTFNYGQANQTYDASGDPSLPVPAGYPFPGMRKFSLVYTIGTQAIQGEAGSVVFVASETGHLQVCVNDNPNFLSDNTGAMLITITVNERSAERP